MKNLFIVLALSMLTFSVFSAEVSLKKCPASAASQKREAKVIEEEDKDPAPVKTYSSSK